MLMRLETCCSGCAAAGTRSSLRWSCCPPGRTTGLIRHSVTSVLVRYLSDDEIGASIDRGDPFDKAGAYAIQDPLLTPVESYEGCYCNVVGLPLWPAIEMLHKAGVKIAVAVNGLLPQCAGCPLRPPGS